MEDQTPRAQATPEVRARITDSFERQGLVNHLGAPLTHVGPGRVHIAPPSRPEVTQQHGYFHARATSAISDSASLEVLAVKGPDRSLVATGQQTLIRVNPDPD